MSICKQLRSSTIGEPNSPCSASTIADSLAKLVVPIKIDTKLPDEICMLCVQEESPGLEEMRQQLGIQQQSPRQV